MYMRAPNSLRVQAVQYFLVVLFIMLHKILVLMFGSVDETLKCDQSS